MSLGREDGPGLRDLEKALSDRLDEQCARLYGMIDKDLKRTHRKSLIICALTSTIVVLALHFLFKW